MSKANDAWGIEVGANAIKAMRLVRKKDEIILADYEVLPFKKVLTTPDINVEEAIQVNLDQFLARHDVSKSTLMVSVTGSMAFAKFAKLPPVDPKSLPKIVAFEAIQQIPFPITEVEWDYQIFAQEDSPDVEVGIVAITKERVNRFLENYYAVGMEPDGIVLSPMAVYNAIVHDMDLGPDSEGMIIVDIGTSSTDVIIVENGQIWIRTLPIGGNNFTEALVRAFKLSFPKAERLKREAGTSKYARQIFQAMRPVFADFVQDMQRSLGFYQTINRDSKLTKLVGLGSTFRLPGMQKFLKQQLQLEVIRPDKYEKLTVDGKQEADFAEHAMNMATAYGLALQGLGIEKVTTNLIPKPILRKKIWKSKTKWFVAAAAMLFIASSAVFARYELTRRGWESAKTVTDREVSATESRATGYINDWNTKTAAADPRPKIEEIRAMLNYRSIWPTLLLDVEEAIELFNPQDALTTSDYTRINAIPPGQRNRIFITQVDYRYQLFSQMPAGSAGTVAAPAAPAATPEAPSIWKPWDPNAAIPGYSVVLSGETTHDNGRRMIAATLVNWLKANAERKDRPYRIVVPEENVSLELPIRVPGAGGGATGAPAIRPPASGGRIGGVGGVGGVGGEDFDGPSRGLRGGAGGGPVGGLGGGIGGGAVGGGGTPAPVVKAEIARPDILAGANVIRFTVRFEVHMLQPEDVRVVESMLNGEVMPVTEPPQTPEGGEPLPDAAQLPDRRTNAPEERS
jgi:type IV pilus assembly protein PilM